MPVLLNFLHQELILTLPPVFRRIAIQHVPRLLAAAIIRMEQVHVLHHEDRHADGPCSSQLKEPFGHKAVSFPFHVTLELT
jgi:hypothetical protein